jgi:phospho-N-acetylmuramoyl-pentapeptide-transferase
MLSELAEYAEWFGPLRLFRYISFRAIGGAATAIVLGMLLAPPIIRILRALKMRQVFRDESQVGGLARLHGGKLGTPTMGGLIIYAAVTISTLLWARWNVFTATALLVYSALTLLGAADDLLKITRRNSRGLPGRFKLLAQAALTVVTLWILLAHPDSGPWISQLWLPFFKTPVVASMPIWALCGFLFLVLAGSSNAINLTDGVDGLAIGCTLTVALAFGLMAYASGHAIYARYLFLPFLPGTGELTVLCAILCAGCLAFLWHNAHPAAVFMGDTGSLALGGLVGVIAFMILQPVTLVIVGGVFVWEALSVIIQVGAFRTTGRRPFRMAPVHHHFELKGWAETQVVIRFWIISLICAIIGLATLKLR